MTVTVLADHRRPATPPAADEAWSFSWLADEAAWEALHKMTGLAERFCSPADMVAWAADDVAALADLRRAARVQLHAPFALQSERDRGRRALMLLADPPTLLPYTTDPDLIESMCICGGYLAYGPGQTLTHVDTCAEELHAPGSPCPDDRNTHKVCDAPSAAVCGHEACLAPNQLHAPHCLVGKEVCCGCCQER